MNKRTFLKRVDKKTNGCWEWTGFKWGGGYGGLKIMYKNVYAHRYSWELHNNEKIPEGMCVMHICDNPPCVNPEHLKLGTQKDNVYDCIAKGRFSEPPYGRGEKSGLSKLKEAQVKAIRALGGTMSQAEIADLFDTTQSNVSRILSKDTWNHV